MQSLSGNCRCQKARSGDSGDVMFPGLKAIRSRPSRCSARCAFGRFSAERPNKFGLRRFRQGRRACRRDRISFFGVVECPLFNTGLEFLRNGNAMHNFATRLFFGPR